MDLQTWGGLAGVLAFFLMLIVEWQRLRAMRLKDFLMALLTGLVVFGAFLFVDQFLRGKSVAQNPTPTPPPTSVMPTKTPVPTETPLPLPAETPTLSPVPFVNAIVNTDTLNLREGPDTNYAIVGKYDRGTALKVLGKDTAEQWLKVMTPDDRVGWMAIKYLDVKISLVDVPVVAAPPTPSPLPEPPTATPEPLGKGGVIQGQGLNARLTDYEIRAQNQSEDAAIQYTIEFINETDAEVEVKLNVMNISATDNIGVKYEDSIALAAKWFDNTGRYGCISISQPVYSIDRQLVVPAKSTQKLTLALNTVGTEGDCNTWGVGRSRVAFETNYIDLKISGVKYRTDQLYEFPDLKWRLKR